MNNYWINIFVLFSGVILAAFPVYAETYSWTDDKGTMNFTENFTSIPQKYRKKVLKRKEIEYSRPPIQSSKSPSNAVNDSDVHPAKPGNILTNQFKAEPKGIYGGKRGEEWASEFSARNSEISSLDQKIKMTQELLNRPTGLNREKIDRLPQELVFLITQRNEAIKRYNELNEKANRAGVPAEYRK